MNPHGTLIFCGVSLRRYTSAARVCVLNVMLNLSANFWVVAGGKWSVGWDEAVCEIMSGGSVAGDADGEREGEGRKVSFTTIFSWGGWWRRMKGGWRGRRMEWWW